MAFLGPARAGGPAGARGMAIALAGSMLPMSPPVSAGPPPWTCPFCPLLCDDRRPEATGCPKAQSALAGLQARPAAQARVDGREVALDEALAVAAARLEAAGQALLGGWGCDVDGARALVRLAQRLGAVVDVGTAAGEPLAQGLRALQDRGSFTTTLAEIRERADLIVSLGSAVTASAPRLVERLLAGRGEDGRAPRPAWIHVGRDADRPAGAEAELLALPGGADDLPDLLVQLHLELGDKAEAARAATPPPVRALAERMRAARYVALLWEPSKLGAQAALPIERLTQLLMRLNRVTRAAALPVSGGDGAMTAQYVHAWMTGQPLRSRHAPGPDGGGRAVPEHDGRRFGAARLLADGAVDALLWVACLAPQDVPAAPVRVVIGPAALVEGAHLGDEAGTVFLPAGVPGWDHGGHLFRVDGSVLMPLHAADGRAAPPSAPPAAKQILALLERLGAARTAA